MSVKQTLKALAPAPLLRLYRGFGRWRRARRNAGRSAEEVFSEIYRSAGWGRAEDGFCSGQGSREAAIVEPYVAQVIEVLRGFGSGRPVLVDLGCGDFRIGRRLLDHTSAYIGVDVVPDLIRHLRSTVTDPRARFEHLDISRDELPPGDVCTLRQVLQHLSNAEIAAILPKLARYQIVLVTEHLPSDDASVPNLDHVHGGEIRLARRSGVYLGRPPFELPGVKIDTVLEVPGHALGAVTEPGVIRTVMLDFRAAREGV